MLDKEFNERGIFMPKLKYSEELKSKVIHYVLEGHSMYQAAKEFYVGKGTVQKWMNAYRVHGVNGICIKQNNHNKYTGDFKIHVIEYKQNNQLSARQTAAHFNIPSWQSILNWEKIYQQRGPDTLKKETRGKANFNTGTMKGRRPNFSPKSEIETLQEENQRLRMENEYLKKLNALIQERERSEKPIK